MTASSAVPGRRALMRLAERWRNALRSPAVATPELVGKSMAAIFLLVGITVIISTWWPAQSGHRDTTTVRLLGIGTALLSPLMLRLKHRKLHWELRNLITIGGTAGITWGIHLDGGGGTAATSSAIYLLVVVHVFYAYAPIVAWLHVCFAASMCVLVLQHDTAVGPSEMVVLLGVAGTLALLVGWLVRAADLAEIDYLTGLLNQRGFHRAATAALAAASGGQPPAVVLMDLDNFRTANNVYGQAGADDLLATLAQQWLRLVPDKAILARHGGDEFALLITGLDDVAVEALITVLRTSLAETGTFSAGAARTQRGESLSMLLLRADSALYEAKRLGRGRLVFAPESGDLEDGDDILHALAEGQFALYYQPIIDLHTGAVVKAEALIRWIHPDRGLIPPDSFIRQAERTGSITALGSWIVSTAFRDAASWEVNSHGEHIKVAVNASARELQDPGYCQRVLKSLELESLPASRVTIELVETDYNVDSPAITKNLEQLAAHGVSLAIDDFGTGYSSLNRLDQMQVHILKIDRSFISPIIDADQSVPLVTAILAMASALKLHVIAEGIETAEQAQWLINQGCGYAQGYLYGRPSPQSPAQPAQVRHISSSAHHLRSGSVEATPEASALQSKAG